MTELSPAARMARWLYTFLYLPASPLVLAYWMGRPDSRSRLGEYLGAGGGDLRAVRRSPVWVHAVSVGEAVAALPVLRRMQGEEFFLTTTIDEAERAMARHELPLQGASLLPVDLPWTMARLISSVRPRAFLLSETDPWPNLLLELGDRDVPAYLVNGRISPGLGRAWRAARVLGRPALEVLRLAFVQREADAARLEEMGLPGRRIRVVGNTKFELGEPPALPPGSAELAARIRAAARPVLVAGSTHDPEEDMLLEALRGAPGPRPLLLLAPRALRRVEPLLEAARERGLGAGRWSEVASIAADPDAYQVLVVDAMGLLSSLYQVADVAWVGGGFAPGGGHNFLEAAYWGAPILGGPGWKNFEADLPPFEAAGAVRRCRDRAAVEDALWELLASPEERRRRGRAGRELLERQQDASRITAEAILEDLARTPSPYDVASTLT